MTSTLDIGLLTFGSQGLYYTYTIHAFMPKLAQTANGKKEFMFNCEVMEMSLLITVSH